MNQSMLNAAEIGELIELSLAEVADLTDLPVEFWRFVAQYETFWEIERFIYVAGEFRITEYYLEAYLMEDLSWYYRQFEIYRHQNFPIAGTRRTSARDLHFSLQNDEPDNFQGRGEFSRLN